MSNAEIPHKPMWRPAVGPPGAAWHRDGRHGMAQISEREELSLPWLKVAADRSILDENNRRCGAMCEACFDEWYATQFTMADGSSPTPDAPEASDG